MGYLTGQFVEQTKKSCQVYLSQQCVSARWAGCPIIRSEENLCADVWAHGQNAFSLNRELCFRRQ